MSEQQPQPDETPEPKSRLLTEPKHVRADCRLIERFGIPDELRSVVTRRLLEIIVGRKDEDTGRLKRSADRSVTSAARVLAQLERLNMDQEKRHADVEDAYLAAQGGQDNDEAERIRKQIEAMDNTILPPDRMRPKPPGKDPGSHEGNGNGKPPNHNGNGNGHA
jgi:hypothetical protein